MDKPESEIEFVDAFNGDTALLLHCTAALLDLDERGALVPHGIGNDARTLLGALASRLARRGAEMQWRPIETAPKEGGPILLFEPPGDEDQIGVGYYEPVTDHEGTEWLTFWETGARCDATHWMPLPPPPAGETP